MAGMFAAVSPAALAQGTTGTVTAEKANLPDVAAKHSLRFGVIGLDHAHIYSMTAAVQRGGGKLVAMYATDQKQIADYRAKFGDVKLARSENEIIEDKSIQLVVAAPIPDQRAPLGVKVMRAGK